jgi:hypothetical protein
MSRPKFKGDSNPTLCNQCSIMTLPRNHGEHGWGCWRSCMLPHRISWNSMCICKTAVYTSRKDLWEFLHERSTKYMLSKFGKLNWVRMWSPQLYLRCNYTYMSRWQANTRTETRSVWVKELSQSLSCLCASNRHFIEFIWFPWKDVTT